MTSSPRRSALTLLLAVLVALGTMTGPSALGQQDGPTDGVAVVDLDGRGHGHGVGMSQWGAYTLATQGYGPGDILLTFYPGTEFNQLGGDVIIGVWSGGAELPISFPAGGELRSPLDGPQAEGFPIAVAPGGSMTVRRTAAGYEVRPSSAPASRRSDPWIPSLPASTRQADESDDPNNGCVICPTSTTTTTAPPKNGDNGGGVLPNPDEEPEPEPDPEPEPEPTPEPDPSYPTSSQPVWAVPAGGNGTHVAPRNRTYRGRVEIGPADTGLRARNHVNVETYLKGMAEVPGSWPAHAVQAQAIAARTYAMRAMATAGELCDSEQCQVYGGISKESAGQNAAVDATRGVVVTYRGRLASTFYSASGGGHSATASEGFGTDYDLPYLLSKPYPESNPKPWKRRFALSDVGGRLGYQGEATSIRVTEVGPSGRATAMMIEGDAGPMAVDPQDFRRKLRLQSTLFSVAVNTTEGPVDSIGGEPAEIVEGSAFDEDPLLDDAAAGDNPRPSRVIRERIPERTEQALAPATTIPAIPTSSPDRRAVPALLALSLITAVFAAGLRVRRKIDGWN